MSDILDQIDAAIEDAEGYIEWHGGSADSAEWHADGSHEVQIGGHYYATDQPTQSLLQRPMSRGGICGERNIMPIGRFEAYLPLIDHRPNLEDMRQRLDHHIREAMALYRLQNVVPPDQWDETLQAVHDAAQAAGTSVAELAEVITRVVMRGDLDLRSMPVTPASATPTSDSNA